MLVVNLQRWFTGDGPILLLLSVAFVPVAIAIAIVRHGLLDIRLVLSRALLYGLLVGVVIAVYAGLVAGLSALVPADADRTVAVAAALVVAFAFNPLRLLLQRVLGRAFFGRRGDPAAAAAASVGDGIADADNLDAVLERARGALRIPRLELIEAAGGVDGSAPVDGGDDGRGASASRAVSGEARPDATFVDLALPPAANPPGTLRVTLRAGEHTLHPDDRQVLGLLTPSLGLLLRTLALSEELRTARAAVVEARERERVRLHRDLHDGLGPTLTSAAYRADAAANLIAGDPDRARALLAQSRADVREALAEVRRVAYGLRPIPLDELGLVAAIRERAGQLGSAIAVRAPEPMPELSPALELAAYRIALEGISNAQRHATGASILVELSAADGRLRVVVDDDGDAPAEFTPGVGIRSMFERAEELGGVASVGPMPGGWRVQASLPLGR